MEPTPVTRRDQLRGSLRAIPLPSLLGLIADARLSGQLNVWDERWTGGLALLEGRLVGASLGPERGPSALAAVAWMLRAAQFALSPAKPAPLPSDEPELALGSSELRDVWVEGEALSLVVPGPSVVPRIALERMASGADGQSFDVNTIKTLVAIDGQRTVADIARGRGFVRTVRELAALARAGVVDFGAGESASIEPRPAPAVATPAPPRALDRLAGLFLKPPKTADSDRRKASVSRV